MRGGSGWAMQVRADTNPTWVGRRSLEGDCEGPRRVGGVANGDVDAVWMVFEAAQQEVVEGST
jgi:hypothetical protein